MSHEDISFNKDRESYPLGYLVQQYHKSFCDII